MKSYHHFLALCFLLTILLIGSVSGTFGKEVSENSRLEELKAEFAYLPENPWKNKSVTFYDGSLSEDDEILIRKWDFDSDNEWDAYGKKVEYSFPESENYEVTLMVIDKSGENDTITKAVSIAGIKRTESPFHPFNLTLLIEIFIGVAIATSLILFERWRD